MLTEKSAPSQFFTACSIEPFLSDQTAIRTTHFPNLSQNVSGIQIAVLKELGVTLYGKDSPHNPSRKAFPFGEYRLGVLYLLGYLLRHDTWDCSLLSWLTEPAQQRQPLKDLSDVAGFDSPRENPLPAIAKIALRHAILTIRFCIAGKNRLRVSHDRKMLQLRVEPVRSIATKISLAVGAHSSPREEPTATQLHRGTSRFDGPIIKHLQACETCSAVKSFSIAWPNSAFVLGAQVLDAKTRRG